MTETELAICTEFGAIIGSHYSPGLHFKRPWDMVTKFDRRILSQSYNGETFLTNDNRGLIADFYVKWRVKEPVRFYTATGGKEELAAQRLADIVKDGIKGVVAQRTLQQIVSAERAAVTGEMFGQASRSGDALGIELVDVRVQRIDLPDDVAARVYEATQTYARAYSKDPEFYAFYRSLQAYEHALGKDGDLLVLTPDGEFFQYLKDPQKRRGAK